MTVNGSCANLDKIDCFCQGDKIYEKICYECSEKKRKLVIDFLKTKRLKSPLKYQDISNLILEFIENYRKVAFK